jgi:bifunctional DNA-binding transcriptional regulator/antitoxin component of YhaV-PrlF toxin-antitoxin module
MQTAVLKLQSKGQIMLPKEWRDEINVEVYQATKKGKIIMLQPIELAPSKEVIKATNEFMKENAGLMKKLSKK